MWCSTHVLFLSEDACHSFEILLGDDLRIRTVWQLCGLWWIGQHLLHIQLENQRGQCESEPGAARAHRSAIFLLQLLFLFCFIYFFIVSNEAVSLWDVLGCEMLFHMPTDCLWANCNHYSWILIFSLTESETFLTFVFRIFVLLSLLRWQPNCH